MAEYKIELTTNDAVKAGTFDYIYITLFGTEGQSRRTELDKNSAAGVSKTRTYTVRTGACLGKLLLVKFEKDPFLAVCEDEWYYAKITVTTPEEDVILFPCYRWVSSRELVELRGAKAVKVFQEKHPLLVNHRKQELIQRKSVYQWKSLAVGLPHISNFSSVNELPSEVRFSDSKAAEFFCSQMITDAELKLKGLLGSAEKWENFEEMKRVFSLKNTKMSEYVAEHWQDDEFFAYQFLNGTNPNVIRRITELPSNFPVTDGMVEPFLDDSLEDELDSGNIFISDQRRMDGIPGRDYYGEPLSVTPGLCLFYLNPDDKLLPVAIQLQQQPSTDNPIFLPSDSHDWLLAKMFIKNADAMDHQAVRHLLNTHFLTEVFTVATLRCFPVVHPLYKLLYPHFRYTLNINVGGRKDLFGPGGALRNSTLGYDGLIEVMRRAHAEVTYSALCLPDNITERGLESIPNFYYRDDGLKLWKIISRFVKELVEHYYPSDSDIHDDTELQEWISEIFLHGFLGNTSSGIYHLNLSLLNYNILHSMPTYRDCDATGVPSSFHSSEELIKFITMVIFTATAQHAAANNGQFDYYSWIPNRSLLLHGRPPNTKGETSMQKILDNLPTIGETVNFSALFWVLSDNYTDMIPLGKYPEERFDEKTPKEIIQDFQEDLAELSEDIAERNAKLDVPYAYMDPAQIENSITI
ncbi:uncharacterized protein V6R79_011270 [Siganus canaliculatus]